MKHFGFRTALVTAVAWAAQSFAGGAHAQSNGPIQVAEGPGGAELEEVTVSARKRQESILNVPVIEQVLSQDKLERMQVTELTDLPKIVPGLNLGHSLLSIGTLVSIRGVGTASQDPGVDQSVSLNLDGLSLGNGLAFSSGMFDVGQVEVLKGPQALFYGKSSPGGVIALRSADPSNQFEVIGRAGYEIKSVNPRAELIVSGPVADTLKLRLAGMYSQADGYFDNVATALPGTGALTPRYDETPHAKDYVLRGTALWDPSSQFTARLKVNYVYDRAIDAETLQCVSAPSGTAQVPGYPDFLGGGEDCKLDGVMRTVDLDPAAFPAALNNGVPFLETHQSYETLELNYSPADDLTLTSTTAYYRLHSQSMVNPNQSTYAGPYIGVNNHFQRREFTEELRASSDYKGPVNFTLGGLYEDGSVTDNVTIIGNGAYFFSPILQDGTTPVDIKTYSLFAQARWNIVERLELAGGLRWTDEKREENPYDATTGQPIPIAVATPSIHSNTFSPEVTLTYRATDDLTMFGALKRGFKAGSFSIATPPVATRDNSFGDEKVQGGEAGLKSRLLDHQLALNVAGYYYHYDGLQVGVISPPQNGVPVIQTVNAATARTYGIDLDAAYRPVTFTGLGLNAAVNWNHGRYQKFTNAPCWGGQLVSEGCNQSFNPAVGVYTAQDLSGTPLVRAPEWQATLGVDYEVPVRSDYTLRFSNSNEFSSRYVTFLAVGRPNEDNYQSAYAKVDLSVALQSPGERWELALIGKNVSDKVTAGNCVASPLRTGVIFANPSGGTTRGDSGVDVASCFADPGREVWLRLTVRAFTRG